MNTSKRIEELLGLIKELESLVKQQAEIIASQSARILELENRLNKNSNNSSKPPSSDGLSKPKRTQSLREKGKRPSGGQKGHKGHTLTQTMTPDEIKSEVLSNCPDCRSNLSNDEVVRKVKRQVFDIEQPQLFVTEHQSEVKWCSCCHKLVRSSFPSGVNSPVQYGNRIKSWAVYLQHAHLLPEDRLQSLFSELWGISLSTVTLNHFSEKAYDNLLSYSDLVLSKIKESRVTHLDETGFRVNGQTQWLHVASTAELTYYHLSPKRKALLSDLSGTVVHDHWKPYYQLKGVSHALCNAHHLRELNALITHEKESWAQTMKSCLLLCLRYKEKYSDTEVPLDILSRLTYQYEQIVNRGLAYHESLPSLKKSGSRGRRKRRTGHNLLLRLQGYQGDVLAFLYDKEIPFTNNQAERDLRMMKCKQKISGSFRASKGAKIFIRIRGFISTVRKQGGNLFDSLLAVVDGKPPPIVIA